MERGELTWARVLSSHLTSTHPGEDSRELGEYLRTVNGLPHHSFCSPLIQGFLSRTKTLQP